MTPELFQRASDLYNELRELPDSSLFNALGEACEDDAELRVQVVRMLEAERRANDGSFLQRPALEDAARLLQFGPTLPLADHVIGTYRLGDRIGTGGMGVVYEAEDLRLRRRVAIKLLPPWFPSEGEEQIRRFQREARAASLLSHPHIVAIFDADIDHGWYYIAMEFVEGKTLRQLIDDLSSHLDTEAILDLIGQTASALAAAHAAGIVHRDIKPENIMFRPDGLVKVLDFGLARLDKSALHSEHSSDLRTQPGHVAGTMRYLSPEQVLGKSAGPQSDIFSLGVVAYELATGKRPFDGTTDFAVLNAILNEKPKPPSMARPGMGVDLDAPVMRALEKDPALRWQTASDLRKECTRLLRASGAGQEIARAHLTLAPAKAARQIWRIGFRAHSVVRTTRNWKLALSIAAALVIASGGAAVYWLAGPQPRPHVEGIVQLTEGDSPQLFVTDGTRLFYAAGNRDADMKIFQISSKGGDPLPMPQLTGMFPFDISPDRTEMLLGQIVRGGSNDGPYPIWVANTLGNAPRRLGDLLGSDARWSPEGGRILYCKGRELWLARSDGTQPRRVVAMNGGVFWPAWSPDGRAIRFTLGINNTWALWEVMPDGGKLHPVFPNWKDIASLQGVWTPNGKYFVFAAGKNEGRDLWALPSGSSLFGARNPAPVRLTTGPILVSFPIAGATGHSIFFQGALETNELIRRDRTSGQWTAYLGGLPAAELDYSRDGKWITYVHAPESSVFRSEANGGERLQLTTTPFFAVGPRWSPDGTQIAFFGHLPGQQSHIYVVPANGGPMRQLTHGEFGSFKEEDCSWSSDGASIVFGATFDGQTTDRKRLALGIVDLQSGRVSKLGSSEGLWSPRWSPDGRYIAALGFPNWLWLYNRETGKTAKLTETPASWPSWSRDGRYVYFQTAHSTQLCRVRIADGLVEQVASLAGINLSGVSFGWVGVDLEGSPITMRIRGGKEIYALDWDAP